MGRPAKPWFRSAESLWYATINGQKVSLGVKGHNNEAAAWREFDRLRSGSPQPALAPPPPEPQPVRPTVTVAEVIRTYLADADGRVQPETFELYDLFLNGFADRYGDLPVTNLTCPLAEAYSRKPNWNDSSRSAFLAVLVRAFRHAERTRLIDRSPLSDLKRSAVASRAADVLLSESEFGKLCEVAPAPFRLFLRFLWLTGCRPNEAAQLTAADIDWEGGAANVRKHKTKKAGKRRIVYLPPDAVTLLRELADRRPNGTLLRNKIGLPWTKASLGMAMRKARGRAGLKGKILYGLRHTFATDALAAGVPDAQVAELLGHSSTQMLHKHYSHLGTKTKVMAEAVRRVR